MSYLSQMVALVHATTSFRPPSGSPSQPRSCAASRAPRASTVGNFWRDIVRQTLYLFLPASLVYAVFLMCAGDPA